MKRFIALLFVAALPAVWSQTAAKSTTTPSASTAAKASSTTTTAAKPAATSTASVEPWIKLPPGVPRVVHLPLKSPFALRYEDVKIGTGAEGQPAKLWHLKYTGWRAADGVKFDSWDEHSQPVMGADGKPEMGPDGKPKLKDPEPLAIPQGVGRVIPGFDFGLEGMKIGGKRRIFIPWQMAYGTHAIPDRPDHPGIPAKSDLIFDVELVDVTDMPAPMRPGMPGARPAPNVAPPHPGASSQPGAAPSAPGTSGSGAPGSGSSGSAATGSGSAPAAKPAAPAQPATQPATPPPATAPSQPATAPQPQSATPPPQK
jgi:peptidylprolyl isomerase